MLAPGYFAHAAGLLRPGELIWVSTVPRAARPGAPATGEVRLALVMVQADGKVPGRAAGAVRLVHDCGRPDDPPAPAAPPAIAAPVPEKRGRGRPPGSRTRRPGASAPAAVPAPPA